MANVTVTPVEPTLTGATADIETGVASSQTATISPSTAQGAIDASKLYVVCVNNNSTASVTLSLGAGTEFSDIGIGAASITVATNTTVIIGGDGFESSRFLTSAGTIVFTQAGAGPTSWQALMRNRAIDND